MLGLPAINQANKNNEMMLSIIETIAPRIVDFLFFSGF